MGYTFPNQRTICIHRESAKADFLGIKNENWKAASRNLSPHALLLYLYLASNANNFELALSPTAIRQEIGMARSTYHDQFNILVDKGYLVPSHGNTFDFYEVPQPRAAEDKKKSKTAMSDNGHDFEAELYVLADKIEINNIRNNTNNDINKELARMGKKPIDNYGKSSVFANPPKGEFVF